LRNSNFLPVSYGDGIAIRVDPSCLNRDETIATCGLCDHAEKGTHMRIDYLLIATAVLSLPLAAQNPQVGSHKGIYMIAKTNVVKAAEKMPEENYGFRPTDSVRSFGQLVGHVADAQYLFCSMALGEKNPSPGIEKGKSSKADLVQSLKDAVAYCDKAFDGLTDAHAADTIKVFGRESTKLGALTFNSAHTMEHYGNMVTYMRMKNLVPPSSESR
jgi:uncharacterized damage-inducible protein DinB